MDIYFDLISLVRTEILEKFMIPGLGISWWRFAVYMALASIVVVALVNVIKVTADRPNVERHQRSVDAHADVRSDERFMRR